MILLQSFVTREISIFINFVNILGAEGRPKYAGISHISESFSIMVVQNMRLLKSILHIKPSGSRIYFNRKRPSILKWKYGIDLFNFF